MRAPGGGRLFGWFLLLVPFIPLTWWFGEVERTRGIVPPSEALLGFFVFGTLAVLLARLVPPGATERALGGLEKRGGAARMISVASLALLLGLLVATAVFAFARRPLLVDSVFQVFQARIFASGALYAPAPPGEAFFAAQHLLVDGGRWFSQYPPGHSGLLAVGVLAGAVWLVPVALSMGTALLMYGFTRRAYDLATARLTLVLLAFAPFFWFMGASHMNHVSALFFVSAFLYLLVRWEDGGGAVTLLLAGLAIGAAFLSRPLTAGAAGLAMAPFVLRRSWRERDPASVLAGALGALLAIGLYLAYNAATTGDPRVPGYLALWGADHGLGFHATPWGDIHSPLAGLRNELTDLVLLSSLLFEGPVPALLPVGVLFAAGWATRRWDVRLAVGFLAIPAAYFFYWHRDAFLGPRYLYSGLAFFIPLTARGILELLRRTSDRVLWSRSALTGVPVSSVAAVLLALCAAYAALYSAPRRFQVYRGGLASMKVDMARAAAEAGLSDAVIFVPVSWGNRLLARMRGAGVPASLAETVYRNADHCEIEMTLRRSEAEAWPPSRTADAVRALEALGEPVPSGSPLSNGDPTLRLAPARAPGRECLDEIAYDLPGYYNYSPFLADQEPSLRGDLVIARDLRGRNRELLASYPQRDAWIYRDGEFENARAHSD